MGRPKSPLPSYCLHKKSGRAYVTLSGKAVYLSAHRTQVSRDEYVRVINEWIQRGRCPAPAPSRARRSPPQAAGEPPADPGGYSVAQLVAAFWKHAQGYYRGHEGAESGALENFRQIIRPFRRLYGATTVADFAPSKLKALREYLIAPRAEKVARVRGGVKVEVEVARPGWSRNYVNRQAGRVRQMFNWGVEEELIDNVVASRLAKVKPLAEGRTAARETPEVTAAPDADVAKVLPLLPQPVRAMVELIAAGQAIGGDADRS